MASMLFPAYAGVIPVFWKRLVGLSTFPRLRGGDPTQKIRRKFVELLFPAYAGVIPTTPGRFTGIRAFPRLRGGDPVPVLDYDGRVDFSPPTRG